MPTKEEFSNFVRSHWGVSSDYADQMADLFKAQGWMHFDGDASNAKLEGDDTPPAEEHSPAAEPITELQPPQQEEEYDDSEDDDEDEEVEASPKPKRRKAATTSRKHYRK